MSYECTAEELSEAFIHGFKPVDEGARAWLLEAMQPVASVPTEWHKNVLLKILRGEEEAPVFYKQTEDCVMILVCLLYLRRWCCFYQIDWTVYELHSKFVCPASGNTERLSIAEALNHY